MKHQLDDLENNEVILAGDRVKELMDSYDWKTYIQPIFDKMILGSIGGKLEGDYILAKEELKKMSEGELKFNLGFAEGVATLYNNIKQYIYDGENELIRIATQIEEMKNNRQTDSDYEHLEGDAGYGEIPDTRYDV